MNHKIDFQSENYKEKENIKVVITRKELFMTFRSNFPFKVSNVNINIFETSANAHNFIRCTAFTHHSSITEFCGQETGSSIPLYLYVTSSV